MFCLKVKDKRNQSDKLLQNVIQRKSLTELDFSKSFVYKLILLISKIGLYDVYMPALLESYNHLKQVQS